MPALTRRVSKRVKRLFVRRGLIDEDGLPNEAFEEPTRDEPVQFGWLTTDGEALVAEPRTGGGRASSAEVAGFSVFAGEALRGRERIEKLCRYLTRPPVANEQLSETNDGRIAVKLKRPRRNGQTYAFMSPLGLLRRLTRLIPPAGMHLLRYAGILAPAAKLRSKVVPVPEVQFEMSPNATQPVLPSRRSGLDWASALRRVYGIDIFACPCGGRIRVLALIDRPPVILRILEHLRLHTQSLPIAPARSPP